MSFLSGLSKVFSTGADIFGKVAGPLGSVLHHPVTKAAAAATAGVAAAGTLARRGATAAVGAARAHPVIAAASAATVGAATMAGGASIMGAGHPAVKAARKALGLHRHRRMHVTNTRALRRALRRVKGFERIAKHVIHITHPGRVGHVKFKFPKRRKRI